jgi:hypothetical protein
MMTGDSGGVVALFYVALAFVFWHFWDQMPAYRKKGDPRESLRLTGSILFHIFKNAFNMIQFFLH